MRERWQVLLEMTCLFPGFTPAMSLAAPRMVDSIDICQRERPGGEHYPGRSGTLRWPQGRPLETLQRPTSVQTRAASSCRDSAQFWPVKPETAAKDTVKFQLKVTSKVRLNQRSFASAEHFHLLWYNTTIIVQPKWRPPCLQSGLGFFFDHMMRGYNRIPTHVHGCCTLGPPHCAACAERSWIHTEI